MKDILTYCTDTEALKAEIAGIDGAAIFDEETGEVVGFNIIKTPTVRVGNETLSTLRVTDAELTTIKGLTNINVIAEVEPYGGLYAALPTADKTIVDRLLPPTETDTTADRIGRFA